MPHSWSSSPLEHWLTAAFAKSFESVVRSRDTSADPAPFALKAVSATAELWGQWKEPIWLDVACDDSEGAALRVGCVGETALALARFVGVDSDQAAAVKTFTAVISQTALGMAGAVGAKLGRAMEFQSATSADAAGNVVDAVELRLEIEGVPHAIGLVPNRSFVKLLNAARKSASAAKSVSREVEKIKASTAGGGADVPENLALLMDVELDLAVSFGSTVMPLEEVIQLGPGAIVELNRGASDPVDLLINNSVIARGEVVVVDGNYGVRITHIVSTSERIAKVL